MVTDEYRRVGMNVWGTVVHVSMAVLIMLVVCVMGMLRLEHGLSLEELQMPM